MRIIKYVKSKLNSLFIGLFMGMWKADIEMLATKTQSLEGDGIGSEVEVESNSVLQDLKQGRVTKEVQMLRYKSYLVAIEASKRKIDDLVINDFTCEYTATTKKKYKRKVHGDPFDTYPVEIILWDNVDSGENMVDGDKRIENGVEKSQVVQENKWIKITRSNIPRVFIENHIKRLYVRNVNETEKLLELYVSKYPDPNKRWSSTVVKDIQKMINNKGYVSSMLEIDELSFKTINCYGIDDHYTLTYAITGFDKVVEHAGYYILKFKTELIDIEDFIAEIYDEDQAKLYEEKAKKEQTFDLGAELNRQPVFEKGSIVDMLKNEG